MIKISQFTDEVLVKYLPMLDDTQWTFVSTYNFPFHLYAYPTDLYFFKFDFEKRLHMNYSWQKDIK